MAHQSIHRAKGGNRHKKRTPPGAAPGTLTPHIGAQPPAIHVIAYGPDGLIEQAVANPDEAHRYVGRHAVVWIAVDGVDDVATIARFGEVFGLHRLALEDVVNLYQRPKVEAYGEESFIVTRMPANDPGLHTEQIGMFLLEGCVLTFHERPGDCFEPVRERLRAGRGRIRDYAADYLAYALIDAVIDAYFPVMESYGEQVEALETALLESVDADLVPRIHAVKRDLLTLRRAIWPQRDMLNAIIRDPLPRFSRDTSLHLRDCYDHTVQLMDIVETYREIASGLVELHLTAINLRMNEVMKVLTVIATIFMPLGFVAGVYGMNFDRAASPWNMPELGWTWGYPLTMALMAAIAGGLVYYFWRKGWIGARRRGAGRRRK